MMHGMLRRVGLLMAAITVTMDAQGSPARAQARPELDAHLRAIAPFGFEAGDVPVPPPTGKHP